MSLFTTLAHRIQATPGLSTVYSWGQQAGTRLQPAYQDASQRVQQVSQQTRPVVDDARRRVSSAGTYVVERVASQPREQIQTPQPQEAAQVAIVRTQPSQVVQSIQPCHQPEQQKPPLTLTSFVVGATKGAQDAGQRFGEKHPKAAQVVHAPLERMATTIHKDKARIQTLHETAQKEAADIDYNKATILGREVDTTKVHEATTGIYKAGADTSDRIRMEGWKSAEYYRTEMQSTPTIAKHLGTVAIVGTTAASRVPEFVGMLPSGLETMAHRPDLIPTAVAIGAHRATFGTAEEFIHHPVQTSADIGAFMVVGGAVKGGVSRIPRGKSLTHDTSGTLLPRKPPSKATPSKATPSKTPPEKVYDYRLTSEGGKTIVTPLDPHAPSIYSKPLVTPLDPHAPPIYSKPLVKTKATAETPMTWIHRPSSVKTPTKVQQIKSTLSAKKQQVVDRIKPTSSATPEYTVQKIGGKEVLAPAPRSLYDRTYHSIEGKVGRVGAVAVAAKNVVSQFRPPRIQVVKTVKGFKSAETTTADATVSSVKPVHKTRIAINKDFPPGKQDISGTYDVSFKQKVATKRHTERTKGTGQQDIQEFTVPETTVETFVRAKGQQVMSKLEPKPTQYVSKTVAGKETLSINQPIYSRIHSGVERVAGKVKPPKPTQPTYELKTIGGKEVLVVEQFSKPKQIYNKIYSSIENKVSDIANIKLVPEKTGYSSKITPDKSVTPASKRQQVMDRLRPKPTPFTLKTIGGKDVFVQKQPIYSKIYSGVESILSRTHKTKQSATMPDQLSSIKTVETSKTKLIKDESFESSGDWVKGKYLSKDKSARAIEVGGGKQPTFKETISAKGQLIAGKIAEKIPLRKSKASGDRTITSQEVKDKTMSSPQQKESGMFGSDQLTIAKQESTSALKHKGEVVSQVKDVSLNVNLAPAFSTFAATSSGAFASTIKAGAISHGYDGSDYDYSTVYPSSAFVPAEIRSQEATGFENIQATSIVPIAATWQPTNIVPVVMQKPVRQAVHEVVPVQRTRIDSIPSYANVTNQFNTQVPRTDIVQLTEIVPIQGESAITRQDEIQITDTVQKQDTVLIPDFMPPSLMPPIEIPIFGKGDGGFLKKKKKKKGKAAPQKQHKIRAWYPAALESVTAEQFQTGGKLSVHIAPAKTTRDLMREFIQTGRGIPTAKQHKARGN